MSRVLQFTPYDKQIEIAHSVRDNKRIVVRSGNGLGKTEIASGIALWFLSCFKPSIVVTTAPTWTSVRNVLWSRINSMHTRSNGLVGGEISDTALRFDNDWYAIGLSTNEQEKFQGYHSKNILFLYDEASGVHPNIFKATEGSMTSSNAKWLMIGNPLSPSGFFYDAFMSPLWKGHHISAFDCPNVKEKRTVIEGLTTWEWVEERRREWGEDHPYYQSRVLGQFPTEGEYTLFPLTVIENAVDAVIPELYMIHKVLGIDVARGGGDLTVFTIMDGRRVVRTETLNVRDLMQVVGKAIDIIRREGIELAGIDVIGIGAGVYDRLREQGFKVVPVNVAEKAQDEQYANLRAEILVGLSNDFKTNNISIPRIPDLIAQLATIEYEFTSQGKWRITSKDKMVKSPDHVDSLGIANYVSKLMMYRGTKVSDRFRTGGHTETGECLQENYVW
jgi:hypothetical protein